MKYIMLITCFLASIILWNVGFEEWGKKHNEETVQYERQEDLQIILKDGNYVESYLLYADNVHEGIKLNLQTDLKILFKDLTTTDVLDLAKQEKLDSYLDSIVFKKYIPNPLLQYNFKVNIGNHNCR